MECLPVEEIPEGDLWTYELKLDGYRIETVKTRGKVTLYSRRGTDLSQRFRYVTAALAALPDETVVDGELVALDEQGKPNFNLLQNFRSAESHTMFYAFDVLVRRSEDLMKQSLSKRREILATTVKPHDHVGVSQVSNQTVKEMLAFVKSHGLEGIIAKRTDSVYEPGRRSGLWVKRRINLRQGFVIGRLCAESSRPGLDCDRCPPGKGAALCGEGTSFDSIFTRHVVSIQARITKISSRHIEFNWDFGLPKPV
jgi:ATP-dependent DNA ligase